jgi:hypothetical protein
MPPAPLSLRSARIASTAAVFPRLRAALWPEGVGPSHRVYAILDGARDPAIEEAVKSSGAEHCCLYAGPLHPELAAVAPYLVSLPSDAHWTRARMRTFFERTRALSSGVFVTAQEELEAMRRHFRRFLRVRTEDGKTLLFRFYDPRVLRVYLPTCTDGELATVFGPIDEYFYEGEEANTLVAAHRGGTGFKAEVLPLR